MWRHLSGVRDGNARTLVRRQEVLETLCGLRIHEHVVRAAQRVQAIYRGFRLRRDKIIFDAALACFLRRCRHFLKRRREERVNAAVLRIQAHWRGRVLRRSTPFGRLFARHARTRRNVRRLKHKLVQVNIKV